MCHKWAQSHRGWHEGTGVNKPSPLRPAKQWGLHGPVKNGAWINTHNAPDRLCGLFA